MKTPRERYLNDPSFKMLVDQMVSQIHSCNYTPSEMREAAILASIIYVEQTTSFNINTALLNETVEIGFRRINKIIEEIKSITS